MKKIEIFNGFPEKLIDTKIAEVKSKNFSPSTLSTDRIEEIQKFPERNHSFCIPYTSHRCQKISCNIVSCIKRVTPDFNVNICFSNVKLSRHYTPRLKCSVPWLEQSVVIYKFECPCSKSYIGETKRVAKIRISEHYKAPPKTSKNNNNKAVFDHINSSNINLIKLTELHLLLIKMIWNLNFIKTCTPCSLAVYIITMNVQTWKH